MFTKILYPTDFSDVSMKAVEYIKQLSKWEAKEILILHVIDNRALQAIETSVPAHSKAFCVPLACQLFLDLIREVQVIYGRYIFPFFH